MKRLVALFLACLLFLATTPLAAMADKSLLGLIASAREWGDEETQWVILSFQNTQRVYKLTVPTDGYYDLSVESAYDVRATVISKGPESDSAWEAVQGVKEHDNNATHTIYYLQATTAYYLLVTIEEGMPYPVAAPVTFRTCEQPEQSVEYGIGFYEEAVTVSVGDAFLPAYWIGFRDMPETATSADESIISADRWRWVANAIGETTVTMTSDTGGTATITVRVVEPPAWELDQRITVSTIIPGNNLTNYTFTPENDGVYVFRSFGECDTSITVYNAAGEMVIPCGFGPHNDLNFYMGVQLTGGETYQVNMRSFTKGTFEAVVWTATVGHDITMELVDGEYIHREEDTYYVYTGTKAQTYITYGEAASLIGNYDADVANPDVVRYDSGLLHFHAPGKTKVTAWTEGSTDTFTIVVVNFVPGDITLDGRVTEADAELLSAYLAGEEVGDRWFLLDCNDDGTVDALDVAAMEAAMAALPGDVDGDGTITSTDARLVLQYYAGKVSETALNIDVADVDSDGAITSTDARLILQYYAGKIEVFPEGSAVE